MTNAMISEMNKIDWWHRIEFEDGIVTSGVANILTLPGIKMPEDLTGKTVLDIGAWDGFYSFEAEKRGAKDVLAVDEHVWLGKTPGRSKAGFDFAKCTLGSNVKERLISVYDISREEIGEYDIVLFLGVIYHLNHPLEALKRVFDVTKDMLILESYTLDYLDGMNEPFCNFFPNGRLNDNVNYLEPTIEWLKMMLSYVGFSKISDLGGAYAPRRVAIHAWK